MSIFPNLVKRMRRMKTSCCYRLEKVTVSSLFKILMNEIPHGFKYRLGFTTFPNGS